MWCRTPQKPFPRPFYHPIHFWSLRSQMPLQCRFCLLPHPFLTVTCFNFRIFWEIVKMIHSRFWRSLIVWSSPSCKCISKQKFSQLQNHATSSINDPIWGLTKLVILWDLWLPFDLCLIFGQNYTLCTEMHSLHCIAALFFEWLLCSNLLFVLFFVGNQVAGLQTNTGTSSHLSFGHETKILFLILSIVELLLCVF